MVARCPRCARLLPADAARCTGCGAELASQLVELVPATAGLVPAPPGGRAPNTPRLRWPLSAGMARVVAVVLGVAVLGVLVGDGVAAFAIASRRCRPTSVPGVGTLLYSDQCTGTELVMQESLGRFVTIDVDRGRTGVVDDPHLLTPWPGTATSSPSFGHIPVVDQGEAWSVPVNGRGPALLLGQADLVLPDGVGGWWIASPAPHGMDGTELRRARGDRAGAGRGIVLGPGVSPVVGTADGLLVSGAGGLSVVAGAHPAPLRTDLDIQQVITAQGHTVLVEGSEAGGPAELWTVDVRTGAARLVGLPGRIGAAVGGAPGAKFSPDGRWLALFAPYAGPRPELSDQLTVVDLRRGTVTAVPGGGTASDQPALGWSADSRWVFFLQAGGPVNRTIGAYRLGARSTTEMRYFPDPVFDLAGVAS